MSSTQTLKEIILQKQLDSTIDRLYHGGIERQRERYIRAITEFEKLFGENRDAVIISSPGRSEISGNHTDHQNGLVLAAAVTVDLLAVVTKREDHFIHIHSEDFSPDSVDISDLSIHNEEANTSAALVRGIASYFNSKGFKIGGFDAYTTSDVPKGSGLSSSACFEVAVGTMLNVLYNEEKISALDVARAGKFAENIFFMKPSGFMDQTACSVGGIVAIDFENPNEPVITSVDSTVLDNSYTLVVVNTGDSHADLSHLYASIPIEMKQVAEYFGKTVLREVPEADFYRKLPELRVKTSDRAILRAHHFFCENKRVVEQIDALENKDMKRFIELTRASGRSSSVYLQNIYPETVAEERSIPLALAMSEWILGNSGAYRIHGGGFAGTILSIVPEEMTDMYTEAMEKLFGTGCCYRLRVRNYGGYCVTK